MMSYAVPQRRFLLSRQSEILSQTSDLFVLKIVVLPCKQHFMNNAEYQLLYSQAFITVRLLILFGNR
jgi:hypothetical protein